MAIVISGKELAQKRKELMTIEVEELKNKYNRVPHLVVILVGDDPGSVSYVTGKKKACDEIGLKNTTIVKTTDITEEELISIINELNNDDEVDGILVQLPLPKHIDAMKVNDTIRPDKDVDGFTPYNVASLYLKREGIIPCTPKGIIKVLESENIEIAGKNAVVIGRSNIVGLPISKLLLDKNATVTTAHSRTKDLASVTSQADILIAAVGKPLFVTADMVKDGPVVIDVGVNRNLQTKKLCGDVDFENVEKKASYITPVPGGVGPLTIAMLLLNTVTAFIEQNK
jgi:methylenetetrahydrofolate dehydrogenase (NADP+)/methenyltetrahydrofolate cyclohydrolase